MTHLKAHGALNNMAAEDEGYAMAIGRAIKAVDPNIIYVALLRVADAEGRARSSGCRWRAKASPTAGTTTTATSPRARIPGTVLKDPKAAAEQALRMVRDGEIVSLNGKRIKVKVHTLCVHGDEATGVVVARGIREAPGEGRHRGRAADRDEAVDREATQRAADKPTLAIIGGTGTLGSGLATRLAAAGYAIVIGLALGRQGGEAARALPPRPPAAAAPRGRRATPTPPRPADVVILTVPWASQAQILDEIAPHVAGKIVVDTTVPLVPPKVARVQLPPEDSAALAAQKRLGAACAWSRRSTTSPATSCRRTSRSTATCWSSATTRRTATSSIDAGRGRRPARRARRAARQRRGGRGADLAC